MPAAFQPEPGCWGTATELVPLPLLLLKGLAEDCLKTGLLLLLLLLNGLLLALQCILQGRGSGLGGPSKMLCWALLGSAC